MKTVRKIIILYVSVVLLVCASCSTLNKSLDFSLIEYPSWVTSYSNRSGEYSFVSKGVAVDEYQATLFAYQDMLSQISNLLGEDITTTKYRELTTTKAIAEYSFVISNKNLSKDGDGKVVVHLLGVCSEDKLFLAKSSIYRENLLLQQQVETLVKKAEAFYRKNLDLEALDFYFQAANLASTNDYLPEELGFNTLVDKAFDLLSDLKLIINEKDTDNVECKVQVRRKNRFLESKVLNANIQAKVNLENLKGEIYPDVFVFSSGNKGEFDFHNLYPNLLSSSEVTFSFYLGKNYDKFYSLLDENYKVEFEDLLSSLEGIFLYSKKFPLKDGIGINVLQFNDKGEFLESKSLTDKIQALFIKDGIKMISFYGEESDDDNKLEEDFLTNLPGNRYLVLCRMGVDEIIQRPDYYIVSINGSVAVKDFSTDTLIYNAPDLQLSKISKIKDDAIMEATDVYEKLVYDILKGFFTEL
ncbi:MAG: hypothetical protein PHD05_01085 [Sphaerochaetaceae bacterium]|nr:hypothetical protein [Sphaerochaetaceae bacterium]